MEGGSSSDQQQVQVAPFVAKTYQMVRDPRTDSLVRWGRDNNSFIVLEPLEFSQRLLPVYFKHNNFSSFIRQLSTYGFRKVDFDKWEFAHESFLRGQIHLLPSIVRRKKSNPTSTGAVATCSGDKVDQAGDEEQVLLLTELWRLRREQMSLDEELHTMSERLQATEGKSQQMLSFLARVVEDPGLLPRLTLAKEFRRQLTEKRRRLSIPPPRPSPPLPYWDPPSLTNGTSCLDPFDGLLTVTAADYSAQSEPENAASTVVDGVPVTTIAHFGDMTCPVAVYSATQAPFRPATSIAERGTSRAAASAAHPFSLLGHGYY